MTQTREQILRQLQVQIRTQGHCIGVAAGSGMTARCACMGGAGFILALSAGKFRQIGLGSFASLLSYSNSNQLVMEFGTQELLSAVNDTPLIFGLNATDPTISLYDYLKQIKSLGFSGINNFPTVGLIDGEFRHALERDGINFSREVEAIRLAHFLDLFTVAFVFDEEQAHSMIEAGADILCIHFGLTTGGRKGAKKTLSLKQARIRMDRIMDQAEQQRPGIIQMIYGGPISRPDDIRGFYENPLCQGYVGGSAFERIPVEIALTETVQAFLRPDGDEKMFSSSSVVIDDTAFIRSYVADHYAEDIRLSDLSAMLHRSVSHLSTKFKQAVGENFTQYLVRYRLEQAAQLIRNSSEPLIRISDAVGYSDYVQFSKMFKKRYGVSPSQYRRSH